MWTSASYALQSYITHIAVLISPTTYHLEYSTFLDKSLLRKSTIHIKAVSNKEKNV